MNRISEAEKLLSASRKSARQVWGGLRIMAWRMDGIRGGIELNRRYSGRDLQTDIAHLLDYVGEIKRLCIDHARVMETHDRKAIAKLHELAQMVRENDY